MGKYRRASKLAHDVLQQLPQSTRKTSDVMALRMIAAAAHEIANWFGTEHRARHKTKKKKRRARKKQPAPSPLLLVPESPADRRDKS
jgi:uncharacterized metal-binding protein